MRLSWCWLCILLLIQVSSEGWVGGGGSRVGSLRRKLILDRLSTDSARRIIPSLASLPESKELNFLEIQRSSTAAIASRSHNRLSESSSSSSQSASSPKSASSLPLFSPWPNDKKPVIDVYTAISQPEKKIPPRGFLPRQLAQTVPITTGTRKSPSVGFDWKMPDKSPSSPVPLILKYFYSPSACPESCMGTIEMLKRTLNDFPGQNIRLYFIDMDVSLGATKLAQVYRAGTLVSYTTTTAEEELDRVEGPRPFSARLYYDRFIANSLRMQKHKMDGYWAEEKKRKWFLDRMGFYYNAAPAQEVGVPGPMYRYSKVMFGDPWDNYNIGVPKVVEVVYTLMQRASFQFDQSSISDRVRALKF